MNNQIRKDFADISFVIDIDDTICNNKNRDYENAIPFIDVISKINYLHENGARIVLYTSRGMVSCKGDLEKIIAKNKNILEVWLQKNNVQYDELIFGKPIADMYIDDKAMNVREFVDQDFCRLNGHSGYSVVRIGNIVRKEMSEDNFRKLSDWYSASIGVAKSPKRISNLYSTMYLEYVDGKSANKVLNRKLLKQLINQILKFKKNTYTSFNKDILIEKTKKHKSADEEWNTLVDECVVMLEELDLTPHATLSHYDYTLANIVVKDGELYLLDSLFEKEASSYLLDFAKLKMSLDGYETLFCEGPEIDKKYSRILSRKLKRLGIYKEVLILELMWVIRLYNYNDNKELVKQFAKDRRKEIG